MTNISLDNSTTNTAIEVFKTSDNRVSFLVNVFEETVWLNQKQMSELFERDRTVITKHINNIFKEDELDEKLVCANFAHTTQHGAIAGKTQEQEVKYYNLDVIISVGYRVKSKRGIQFRQWATRVLKQYLLNGYAVNESRIRKIEESLDELVSSQKLMQDDVDGIKNLLLKLIEKPIIIHNHNSNSRYN